MVLRFWERRTIAQSDWTATAQQILRKLERNLCQRHNTRLRLTDHFPIKQCIDNPKQVGKPGVSRDTSRQKNPRAYRSTAFRPVGSPSMDERKDTTEA